MLKKNLSTQRCLVLIENDDCHDLLRSLFDATFVVDYFADRKKAIRSFLQLKHQLLLIDAELLPRFPFRLVQLFKIAHRIPGMIIFNTSRKNVVGFNYIKDLVVDNVEPPFDVEIVQNVIASVKEKLNVRTRKKFFMDFLIQLGVAIPLVIFLIICTAGILLGQK